MAMMRTKKKTMTMMTPTLTGLLPTLLERKLGGHWSRTSPAKLTLWRSLLPPWKDWTSLLMVKLTRQPWKPGEKEIQD